ncbi:GNAT family N-acetyltransferase [Actinophytocola sp.]|uniref:GNAT family N-acetyltransferase n=1 Tax=Actinophytocola sp. TaxID=1872138 RepID=UPI002ED5E0BA
MTLRVLALDDWPLWRAARLAALTDSPDAFTVSLADWHGGGEEQWLARLAMPGAHNVVAVRDGEPVGLARGVPGADGYELRSVWVAPVVRGLGVGGRLLADVEEWAVRAGAPALRHCAHRQPGRDHLLPAARLHRANGDRRSGRDGQAVGIIPAMAYDLELADRIRELVATEHGVDEKRMFGGLAFLVNGNMSVAASGKGGLLVRVGPEDAGDLVDDHVRPAIMGGREMRGWLRVDTTAVDDSRLREWVDRGVSFARSLPVKTR